MSSKFIAWVYFYGGPEKVAPHLGVSRQSIYNWMWGKRYPEDVYIKRIVKLSRKMFTVESLKKELDRRYTK